MTYRIVGFENSIGLREFFTIDEPNNRDILAPKNYAGSNYIDSYEEKGFAFRYSNNSVEFTIDALYQEENNDEENAIEVHNTEEVSAFDLKNRELAGCCALIGVANILNFAPGVITNRTDQVTLSDNVNGMGSIEYDFDLNPLRHSTYYALWHDDVNDVIHISILSYIESKDDDSTRTQSILENKRDTMLFFQERKASTLPFEGFLINESLRQLNFSTVKHNQLIFDIDSMNVLDFVFQEKQESLFLPGERVFSGVVSIEPTVLQNNKLTIIRGDEEYLNLTIDGSDYTAVMIEIFRTDAGKAIIQWSKPISY